MDSGEINLDAHSIKSVSPRHISNEGVAHIPEDRNRDGLIAYMTVAENFILDSYHRPPYSKGIRLDHKAMELESIFQRLVTSWSSRLLEPVPLTPSATTLATRGHATGQRSTWFG